MVCAIGWIGEVFSKAVATPPPPAICSYVRAKIDEETQPLRASASPEDTTKNNFSCPQAGARARALWTTRTGVPSHPTTLQLRVVTQDLWAQ